MSYIIVFNVSDFVGVVAAVDVGVFRCACGAAKVGSRVVGVVGVICVVIILLLMVY